MKHITLTRILGSTICIPVHLIGTFGEYTKTSDSNSRYVDVLYPTGAITIHVQETLEEIKEQLAQASMPPYEKTKEKST